MLPIYETMPLGDQADCLDLMEARNMPPADTEMGLLRGSGLIIPGSTYEAKVLEEFLGISRLTQASFLLDHVLPRYASLEWTLSWLCSWQDIADRAYEAENDSAALLL